MKALEVRNLHGVFGGRVKGPVTAMTYLNAEIGTESFRLFDPLVISESNFLILRDFSLSNGVPLYVPIPSLAERGATASVGVSFRAVGRAAARVAKLALAESAVPALSFTEPAETVLNTASAAKVGLAVDAETLKKLSRVIP